MSSLEQTPLDFSIKAMEQSSKKDDTESRMQHSGSSETTSPALSHSPQSSPHSSQSPSSTTHAAPGPNPTAQTAALAEALRLFQQLPPHSLASLPNPFVGLLRGQAGHAGQQGPNPTAQTAALAEALRLFQQLPPHSLASLPNPFVGLLRGQAGHAGQQASFPQSFGGQVHQGSAFGAQGGAFNPFAGGLGLGCQGGGFDLAAMGAGGLGSTWIPGAMTPMTSAAGSLPDPAFYPTASLALSTLHRRRRSNVKSPASSPSHSLAESVEAKAELSLTPTPSAGTPSPSKKPGIGVPEEKKDALYWERRRKNNEAAKRSRDSRRRKEEEVAMRAAILEQENLKLRAQVSVLKQETGRLQLLLYSGAGAGGHHPTSQHSAFKPEMA